MDHHEPHLSHSLRLTLAAALALALAATVAARPALASTDPVQTSAGASPDPGSSASTSAEASPEGTLTHVGAQAALALPQPLQLGVEVYRDPRFRAYAETGYFKVPLAHGSRSLRIAGLEMGARYFPFEKVFFAGLGVGYRNVGFSTDMSSFQISGQEIASDASLNLSTFYLAPTLGLSFALGKSVFLGLDLGVQLPLIASGTMSLNSAPGSPSASDPSLLQVNSGDSINRIAALIIPSLTLLSLTWYWN